MNQKEKSLLIIKSIILADIDNPDIKPYLVEKIEACLELKNPEVILSQEQRKYFEKLKEEARRKGIII